MVGATEHVGSWWPEWAAFLAEHGGAQVAPGKPGNKRHAAIEAAPGRYVKVQGRLVCKSFSPGKTGVISGSYQESTFSCVAINAGIYYPDVQWSRFPLYNGKSRQVRKRTHVRFFRINSVRAAAQ